MREDMFSADYMQILSGEKADSRNLSLINGQNKRRVAK
jgi:hypothetical protein